MIDSRGRCPRPSQQLASSLSPNPSRIITAVKNHDLPPGLECGQAARANLNLQCPAWARARAWPGPGSWPSRRARRHGNVGCRGGTSRRPMRSMIIMMMAAPRLEPRWPRPAARVPGPGLLTGHRVTVATVQPGSGEAATEPPPPRPASQADASDRPVRRTRC